jgi:conjugal transfer mating pair stabilization protein TraG
MFGMYEVITYGGGANYRDIFIGVALLCGTDAMSSLIRLAMLLGLIMVLFRGIVDLNAGRGLKWFIMCAVIYGVVLVPKVTVHVTDKFNPALAGADVANVPLGVAFASSVASQIGARAIQMAETAFGDPNDVQYSKTGMIYGANFMAKATKITFTDELYKQNFNTFINDCVLYEIQDNQYTIDDLAKATNIMEFVTVTKPANPARSMVYINAPPAASEIITCPTAGTRLSAALTVQGQNAALLLSRSLEPERTDTDAARITRAQGQAGTLAGLMGFASNDGQKLIEQAAVANQLRAAVVGGDTSAGASLAAAQAEVQTHNTQTLLGPVGAKAIILLKIVVDCLFIGMFGIMFPLFLLPQIGLKLLQGYFTGFFYLQLWGPMYVIIHKIAMTASIAAAASAAKIPGANSGLTLQTVSGVGDINTLIQGVASGMILMVPVISAGLTKGAMSLGSQGEALLQPFRSGAEQAAANQTSGNYSFGNTSMNTHSFNNAQGNKVDTSRYLDTGRSSVVTGSGDTLTTNRDGSRSLQAARADMAVSAEGLKSWSAGKRESASLSSERSAVFDKVATDSRSLSQQKIHDYAMSSSVGTDTRRGGDNTTRDSQSSSAAWISSLSQNMQSRFGISKEEAAQVLSRTQISTSQDGELKSGLGGTRGGLGAGAGITTRAGGLASDSSDKSFSSKMSAAADYARTQLESAEGRKAIEKVEMQSLNDSWSKTASQSKTTRDVAAQTWSSTAQFAESRKLASSESERLAKEADRAETISETVRGSRSNEFFRFAMGDATTPGYFRFEPQTGRERSDSEIASLLQGRDEISQQRLADGVEVFMKRYPPPAAPPLMGQVSNDVREPQILGVGPDVERSFEDSKSALENAPGNQVAGAAKREIDSARGRVRAPDAERTVTSPAEAAGPLTPEVDQALARADLLKKPTPVVIPKPQRDKED